MTDCVGKSPNTPIIILELSSVSHKKQNWRVWSIHLRKIMKIGNKCPYGTIEDDNASITVSSDAGITIYGWG